MSSHIGQVSTITVDDEEITRYVPSTKRGGTWVRLGLEEFRIPPLGFLDIQELTGDVETLRKVEGAPTPEQWKSVHQIVWAAMKRNYPGLKLDDVQERIDMGNWLQTINAVLGISGYERGAAKPGER